MKASPPPLDHRKPHAKTFWIALISFILLFLALVDFSPWWHDKYFGVAQNESAAVGGLRKINALESQYAAAHSEKGFACELSLLPHPTDISDPHNPIAALLSGEWSGYRFAIVGCTPEPSGMVLRYSVTAVPTRPYSTGVRAFCTDQSHKVFYDPDGSSSQCLARQQELPDLKMTAYLRDAVK